MIIIRILLKIAKGQSGKIKIYQLSRLLLMVWSLKKMILKLLNLKRLQAIFQRKEKVVLGKTKKAGKLPRPSLEEQTQSIPISELL